MQLNPRRLPPRERCRNGWLDSDFPLRDIRIDPGGDGRTVTAYAAVFDTPTKISDLKATTSNASAGSVPAKKSATPHLPQGKRTTWL